MRVVQLCPSAAFGGTEAVAETLHRLGLQAGWQSTLVVPTSPGSAPSRVNWRQWAWSQRLDADVVHAHLPSPERLGAALVAAGRLPMVVTFHLLPHDQPWPRDRVTKLPTPWLLRLAAWRSRTRWVALSRHDRGQLAPMLGDRPRVVRNAPPEARDAQPIDWPGRGLRLASVGRLHEQKGFDRMLLALAHPTLLALDWHWVIVGEGTEQGALEALCNRLGLKERVRFAGAMPAAAVLRGADLLLSPSRYEGMPLVPLEAAEAGVPVLASSIEAHRELFSEVPAALLPEEESAWPATLAAMMGSRDAQAQLRRACVGVLDADPRRSLWRAYEALYHEAMQR